MAEAQRQKMVVHSWDVHPIEVIEQYGDQLRTKGKSSERIQQKLDSIRFREFDKLEKEMQLAELRTAYEKQQDDLEETQQRRAERKAALRAKEQAESGTRVTGETMQSDTSANPSSIVNDPKVMEMVAAMPADRQQAFFESVAKMELQTKNPQMFMLSTLMDTYRDAQRQKGPAPVSEIDQMQKFVTLQETMRQNWLNSNPQLKKVLEGSPQTTTDPNSAEGQMREYFKKWMDKQFDALIHGTAVQNAGAPVATGVGDTSMEFFMDEATGEYLPKKLHDYNQYLQLSAHRREVLDSMAEGERLAAREKMIEKRVIEPIMELGKPILDELGQKLVEKATSGSPKMPRTKFKEEIPKGVIVGDEFKGDLQKEKIPCPCGNEIIVEADPAGVFPDKTKCPKCGRVFNNKGKA